MGTVLDVRSYIYEEAKRRHLPIRCYIEDENRYVTIAADKLNEGVVGNKVFRSRFGGKYKEYQLVSFSVRSAEQKIEDANVGGLFGLAKDLTGRADWAALG